MPGTVRLADAQRDFLELLEGDRADSRPFTHGPVPIRRALNVHRATIQRGLINALSLSYPTIQALVGTAFFDSMAIAYGRTHPRCDPTLARYGDAFRRFLADYVPARDLLYLVDVAELDHAVQYCQAANEGSEPFEIDPSVTLELPTSLMLLALDYPADRIRAAIFENDDAALTSIDMTPKPRAAAIWRSGRSVIVKSLAPAAMRFLVALQSGACPEDALAAAASAQEGDVLTTLQQDVFAAPFARVRPNLEEVE